MTDKTFITICCAVTLVLIMVFVIIVAVADAVKKRKNPCRKCMNRRGHACLGCVHAVYKSKGGSDEKM